MAVSAPLLDLRKRWAEVHRVPEAAVGFDCSARPVDLRRSPLELGWSPQCPVLLRRTVLQAYPTDDQFAEGPESTPKPAEATEEDVGQVQEQHREVATAAAAVWAVEPRIEVPLLPKSAAKPRRFRLPVILEEEEHHIADMEWSKWHSSFTQAHGLPVDWVLEVIKVARRLSEMQVTVSKAAPPHGAQQGGSPGEGLRQYC